MRSARKDAEWVKEHAHYMSSAHLKQSFKFWFHERTIFFLKTKTYPPPFFDPIWCLKSFKMKSAPTGFIFALSPVFIVAADFIASRFTTRAPNKRSRPQSIFANHVYGTRFYNTSLRKVPRKPEWSRTHYNSIRAIWYGDKHENHTNKPLW